MSLTKKNLEHIQDLLEGREIPHADKVGLRRAVASAIWQMDNQLSKAERKAIQEAEARGLVQVAEFGRSGFPDEELERQVARKGWMVEPKSKAPPSRMKPEKIDAKDGDELLAALGL